MASSFALVKHILLELSKHYYLLCDLEKGKTEYLLDKYLLDTIYVSHVILDTFTYQTGFINFILQMRK